MKRIFKFLKRFVFVLLFGHLIYIVALKWINPPITITQFNSWIDGHGLNKSFISYAEIPTSVKLAVIASEDQKFAIHKGFDVEQIKKAIDYNEKNEGQRIRGGSTISQQVAKNVFLWQKRSWLRKGLETYFTFMIELIWGKERILEVYLNEIEMGIGTFGIQAASERYFQKSASKLTKNEAARIAVNLPNPKKYRVNPPSAYVSKRAIWVERQMRNLAADAAIKILLEE